MNTTIAAHRIFRFLQLALAVSVFAAGMWAARAVYRLYVRQASTLNANTQQDLQAAITNDTCPLLDNELCNFLFEWRSSPGYNVNTVDSYEGYYTELQYSSAGANRFHVKAIGSVNFEFIGIGSMVYAPDQGQSSWLRQNIPDRYISSYHADFDYNFDIPFTHIPEEKRVTYERITQESCGEQQCLKYRIADPHDQAAEMHYFWFDTTDYRLRYVLMEHGDGSSSAHTVSYEPTAINPPSNSRSLKPNEIVPPGRSGTITLPAGMDLDAYLEQYFPPG